MELNDDKESCSVREKKKRLKKVSVDKLSREELEARVLQLEAQNVQLQNILTKKFQEESSVLKEIGKQKKRDKPFDFSKYSKRHVLLKLAYLGWDYQGYAIQDNTSKTIENNLFEALLMTKLIESRETSNYHRCGRTDKGVSAFDQVISITLRSRLNLGDQKNENGDDETLSSANMKKEIDYVDILNKVLPSEIQILAWCPVDEGFSARFDCTKRKYKYFFPKGNYNIELMNKAGQYLKGPHDYRNLCKMDVGNGVVNFKREIKNINITLINLDERDSEENHCIKSPEELELIEKKSSSYSMCVATIEGKAFLWHQVRCIMAILFLVGEGKEDPDIILQLLDVENYPRKPQYALASELPLNLYETSYEDSIEWRWNYRALLYVVTQMQTFWAQHNIKATMVRHILHDLESCLYKLEDGDGEEVCGQSLGLLGEPHSKKGYRQLMTRPKCSDLETRVDHYVKRRRLDPNILDKEKEAACENHKTDSLDPNIPDQDKDKETQYEDINKDSIPS
ncbi:unnamed protein product [Meganyctiphanes norvegica]|uniref:Pseudouridine synthase I TruA alpha/beta domain-containing protein n=1 Tax=Meganyctiphanes norvegica TaxID=48144 RepID=A0AAV2RHI2_MEGNR